VKCAPSNNALTTPEEVELLNNRMAVHMTELSKPTTTIDVSCCALPFTLKAAVKVQWKYYAKKVFTVFMS
jgi:hypothetical protein